MTTRPLETVYEETRTRVVALIRDPGSDVAASAAAVAVPACPSWSVRDVLAHVTGLYSDIVSGNIGGAATDAWTAAQVEARRSMTIDELLAESDEVGPAAGPEPVGEISADPFELFRAFTGRRSAAQIRRFGWTVDPEPYLALFDLWPFTIRETDLVE